MDGTLEGVPEDVMVVDEDLFAGDFVKHHQTGRLGKILWIGRRGHMVVEFHQWGDEGYVEEWRWVSDFVKTQIWNANSVPARTSGDVANMVSPDRRVASSAWRWLTGPY
jgi:hypothetical protein